MSRPVGEPMNLEPIVVIVIVAIAVVGLVGLRIATRGARQGGAADLAASKSPGRHASSPDLPAFETPGSETLTTLDAAAIAYRIGAAGPPDRSTSPIPGVPPPAVGGAAETAAIVRAAAARTTYLSATYYAPDGTRLERTAMAPPNAAAPAMAVAAGSSAAPTPEPVARPVVVARAPRERLMRDTGMALVVLAAVGLIAVAVSPSGPAGRPTQSVFSVIRASATAEPSADPEASESQPSVTPVPSGNVAAETDTPVASPTHASGARQAPTSAPAVPPRPTPTQVRTATPRPTPTHRATASPTPTDGSTPSPLESATPPPPPTPTPEPTPEPTPSPTPLPTPEPSPS